MALSLLLPKKFCKRSLYEGVLFVGGFDLVSFVIYFALFITAAASESVRDTMHLSLVFWGLDTFLVDLPRCMAYFVCLYRFHLAYEWVL